MVVKGWMVHGVVVASIVVALLMVLSSAPFSGQSIGAGLRNPAPQEQATRTGIPHSYPVATQSHQTATQNEVSASYTSSYVPVGEFIPHPSTTPIVVSLIPDNTNVTAHNSSWIFSGHFTAPTAPKGGWGLITVNFTRRVAGNVFDGNYGVWMNNVQVMFGTFPEYGLSSIVKNITEYESVMNGQVDWTLLYPVEVAVGVNCVPAYFADFCSHHISLSLDFYPASGAPPSEPTSVIPLWNLTSLSTSSEVQSINATVPSNTVSAVLQVYQLGWSADESWYLDTPAFRAVNVTVGSVRLATILPYVNIQTGEIDLFAWRGITSTFSMDNRAEDLNITSALGMIEGTRTWNVSITPTVLAGASWSVTGDILVYTSPAATGAVMTSYEWTNWTTTTQGPSNCSFPSTSQCYFNETAKASYSYSSQINLANGGKNTAKSQVTLYFTNNQSISPIWQNQTQNEITQLIYNATNSTGADTNTSETWTYPIGMQIETAQVITGTDNFDACGPQSNSPCPEGVIISLVNDFYQTRNDTLISNGSLSFYNETTLIPLSNFTAAIEYVDPTGAILTGISLNDATTTKSYIQYDWKTDPNMVYTHVVAGSDYINNETLATNGLDVETVYLNSQSLSYTETYLVRQVGMLNAEVTSLSNRVASLSGQLNMSDEEVAVLSSELHNASVQLSVVWGQLNASSVNNTNLTRQLKLDQGTIVTLNAEISSLQTQVGSKSAYFSPIETYALMGVGVAVGVAIMALVASLVWRRRRRES